MEDKQIIALFWNRQEEAIEQTGKKYGTELERFAASFLGSSADGTECVNDAYYRAWNTIPPQEPSSLRAYMYKLLRSSCIDRYRRDRAGKRGGSSYEASLTELEDCLSGGADPEQELELKLLGEAIGSYLSHQSPEKRQIFLRRYYFADPIEVIATDYSYSVSRVKSLLHRLRLGLKEHLQKEDFL